MTLDYFEKHFRDKATQSGYSEDSVLKCLNYAKPLIEKNLPVIFNTANLAALVGYNKGYLKKAVSYTNYFYRSFYVKRRGGGRPRRLSEPLPSLKEIQYWILENILSEVPVSRFAKAYVKDRNLIDNVRYHRNKDLVMCLDIKDFFSSIDVGSIETIFLNLGYSSNISNLLSKLCCCDQTLPQGAPTSPYLSNLFMRDFDSTLSDYCKPLSIRYTRYADDITLSGIFDPKNLENVVRDMLAAKSLNLNYEKIKIMARHERQIVTGLVVNTKIQVPKFKRDEIRQEIYYIKKFGLIEHLQNTRNTRENYLRHLLGKINFVLSINSKDKKMKESKEYVKTLLEI